VANYTSGTVASFQVNQENGELNEGLAIKHEGKNGPNVERQEGPHAHSIYKCPFSNQILSCDLGLDLVFVYSLDENGMLKK
jgi:6-phosphogluconolactonase